ncbi:GAF domain-containing sensor histidine kinase [Halobacterium yunchengense]|uniref:GAF domain-containing sensor histidine kinase n=1 Tax=Halobacterium yunchengense TaxID=3108497 RepID=UPI00300BDA11
MVSGDSLVGAVSAATERADGVQAVREAVCAAVVDDGYEFACFSGSDGTAVAASRPGAEPPPTDDVVPTYRSAAAAATGSETRPGGDRSSASTVGDAALQGDGDQSTDVDADEGVSVDASGEADLVAPADRQVTCISREDGFAVTVPVVAGDDYYGTLAFGPTARVDDEGTRDLLAAAGTLVGHALAAREAERERDDLRDTVRRERRQFEKLHSVAAAMVGCEDERSVYHLAIDAAENILEFDVCGIDVVEDGYFVPVATSTNLDAGDSKTIEVTEGVAGRTYQDNRTMVVDDVAEHPDAAPANPDYRSVLSVPIEGVGVFQAGAEPTAAFSAADAELVELLMAHVSATLGRLRSEAALRESERKYRTLVEQSHDAVTIFRDGEFAFVNERATELFDRDRAALLDADVWEFVHAEDRPKFRRVVGELTAEAGRQETFEGRIRRPDGDVRSCEFSATSIAYGGGVGVLGSIRDITERKERERDLQRQNERLEEFASVVSHDLRSPINVARGSVDLARETGEPDHLDRAADALDRMETLVEDILRLARQGRLVDETTPVPLDDVAAAAWRSVAAPEATLSVEADVTVEADRTRLRELFENLFRNAVEHAGSDVAVTVTARADGFVVADDGPGLPADRTDEVFERGVSSTEDGTGFGLAIVESIAEAHGWAVEALAAPPDDVPGDGAAFAVTGCRLT